MCQNNETRFIKWHFANTCRRLHSGSICVAEVATSLTRDSLGSGHSRSFWHSDLRNLSVVPHFEGNRRLGGSCVPWAPRCVAHLTLRSRPTGESVIPAPDQFREREVFTSNKVGTSSNLICSTACSLEPMFTSNMSWDFIQLECSTCRKLTRANVHFAHELGLHPT